MKILHIAPDSDTALVAERVVHAIAQNVTLNRLQTPASALEWLHDNRDAAAVIVEVQAQSCASFVEQLRGDGLTMPVVVAAGSAHLEPALAALNSGANGYVLAGPSLEAELPRVVAAAIEREGRRSASLARETRIGLALQERLFELEGAIPKAAAELTAATAALDEMRQARREDAVAAGEHLFRREAELRADVAEAVALRTALDNALADAEAAHRDTRQRATVDLAAAAERQAALEDLLGREADRSASLELKLAAASAREAELVERLAMESDARAALELDLTGTRAESARGRNRSRRVVASYRQRAREQQSQVEAQLASERTTADRELRARDEEIRQLQLEHETLRRLLGTTQDQVQRLHNTADEERQAHERARQKSESELQRVSAEYGQIRQSFDRLQTAFQTLEEIAGEHVAERGRLEALVTERDSQLSAMADRHRVAEQGAQDALAALQEKLRQALDTGGAEIARLHQEIAGLRRELDATWTHAETLRGVAERVPDLQTQLERSQNERRRQFERAPYALCQCSETGAITDANHAFVTLLGGRRIDDVRNTDFLAAARDSAGDLGWLIERARTTRRTETVETQWKTWDGRRLVVRLQALVAATGSIDIVAEDLTSVRALEERLRQAQRMEAVGRLASEVAVTCDGLLSDVTRGAHEWLAKVGSDDALRRHAERLLTDVTRAAGFLRQLGTYGNEQVRALEPVSAQRVLRNLAPVLKRLVGDQIKLVLPKSAGSFNVDVEAERLERVLTNVAGYARERMPSGGQVRIDLATRAVGRRFVARYSNVRPGDHVLITVTELPAVGEFCGVVERSSPSSDRPGVDLGVLAGLIASCGGHLWLEAQPAGNMVLKIHLPKAPADSAAEQRGGRLARWFRSAPAARARA